MLKKRKKEIRPSQNSASVAKKFPCVHVFPNLSVRNWGCTLEIYLDEATLINAFVNSLDESVLQAQKCWP